ncbi:MAG: hypothetical protein JWO82_1460 [Akkermansiaceae bacterium]|nr:hypothetical protein [Akkermansiaceae bacterium]
MTTLSMHPELGQEVPIAAIDKELRKLWSADEARTNASLMNLAVYSEVPEDLEKNSAAVRELTQQHACRAILIGIDRAAPEASITAWITAHCHLAEGRKSVCCEQIAFALTGKATGRLRNTVFAHLASDLPLIFWWQGELSPLFEDRLYSLVDRFVFDSASWADPKASFGKIDAALSLATRDLVMQDLAWTRTYQFRVSVAALFDDAVALAALPAVQSVEITAHPAHRGSALQLLAWLVVQAGWKDGVELELDVSRRSGNKESFAFQKAGGEPVEAVVALSEDSTDISLLRITAGEVVVEITREAGSAYVERSITGPGYTTHSTGPADPEGAVKLLAEQLSRGGKNSLFAKVLPKFRELLEKGA